MMNIKENDNFVLRYCCQCRKLYTLDGTNPNVVPIIIDHYIPERICIKDPKHILQHWFFTGKDKTEEDRLFISHLFYKENNYIDLTLLTAAQLVELKNLFFYLGETE